MSKSKIEWTDEVWNPVTGCTKVSAGCKHCYAEREWPRFYGREVIIESESVEQPKIQNGKHLPIHNMVKRKREFTDVRCHSDRLDTPLHWRKPRRVFVNSMSDLFHEDVPDEFICQVFSVMDAAKQHRFQILTKRPERMKDFFDRVEINCEALGRDFIEVEDPTGREHQWDNWPLPNVWLGVSVEDQATADARIPLLLQTPAAVRFVSAEPLLGHVNLSGDFAGHERGWCPRCGEISSLCPGCICAACEDGELLDPPVTPGVDWVIAGGESGPKARPSHPDWFRSLRDQCQAANVPFFFKQWGEFGIVECGDCSCISSELCIRTGGRVIEFRRDSIGKIVQLRVGKKKAGNTLDGKQHLEFPQ